MKNMNIAPVNNINFGKKPVLECFVKTKDNKKYGKRRFLRLILRLRIPFIFSPPSVNLRCVIYNITLYFIMITHFRENCKGFG